MNLNKKGKIPLNLPIKIKSQWTIEKCFEEIRFNKDYHLGLGDIRLTIGQQEEICKLVNKFYKNKNKL